MKGGSGSGFHGHAGRPGKVGGSQKENRYAGYNVDDYVDAIEYNYDPENTNMSAVDFVKQKLKTLPAEILTQSRVASITIFENPEDSAGYILSKWGEEGQGVFDRGTGEMVVTLFNSNDVLDNLTEGNEQRSARILWHEIGHSLDSLIVSDEYESVWNSLELSDQDEDFAEWFAEYQISKQFNQSFDYNETAKKFGNLFRGFGL